MSPGQMYRHQEARKKEAARDARAKAAADAAASYAKSPPANKHALYDQKRRREAAAAAAAAAGSSIGGGSEASASPAAGGAAAAAAAAGLSPSQRYRRARGAGSVADLLAARAADAEKKAKSPQGVASAEEAMRREYAAHAAALREREEAERLAHQMMWAPTIPTSIPEE